MINLEPIPANIQRRLNQKQKVLSRETREFEIGETNTGDLPELTYDMMATRTPFLRMSSGLEEPVVLMGGELSSGLSSLPSGYNEIYGTRDYLSQDDLINVETGEIELNNKFKRPIPGVKSVDAEFLGGSKATRKATINWTCWSFDDIDRLTPHFLQHGRSVLIEWGWVYSSNDIYNLPNFRELSGFGSGDIGKIKKSAYTNYREEILNNYGNLDVMSGIVSNYEYSTREDGAFDCQTMIMSQGVNLFKGLQKNTEQDDKTAKLEYTDIVNKNSSYAINTNVQFKAFLRTIDNYVKNLVFDFKDTKKTVDRSEVTKREEILKENIIVKEINEAVPTSNSADPGDKNRTFFCEKNSFILCRRGSYGAIEDVWVRWGWFEDYILSQFVTLTNKDGDIVGRFRSVEQNEDGTYESVRIRNSDYFETYNFKKYILPGQFFPLKSRKIPGNTDTPGTLSIKPKAQNNVIEGDVPYVTGLAELVKENFNPYSTEDSRKIFDTYGISKELGRGYFGGRQGFMRNILVNTKMIKEAFDVLDDSDKEAQIEPMNMLEGMKQLLTNMNSVGSSEIWNLEIVQDELDQERLKIIDNNTSFIDFSDKDLISSSKYKTFFNNNSEIINQPGVFYFPVWRTDSLVKSQNIQAKIPSSLQIATMYGSNVGNFIQEPDNIASNHSPEGVAVSAIASDKVDARFVGTDIAIRNSHEIEPGKKDEENELVVSNSRKILDWMSSPLVQNVLGLSVEKKRKLEENAMKAEIKKDFNIAINNKFKDVANRPLPNISQLSDFDLEMLFSDKALTEILNLFPVPGLNPNLLPSQQILTEEQKLIQDFRKGISDAFFAKRAQFIDSFASKYDYESGEMRSEFMSKAQDKTTYLGKTNNDNVPLLIPLEIELEIDGIGGIYPGNSFHSTYLPERYQDRSVFQIVSVNHNVSETGWKVTIVGKMRTSLSKVYLGKVSSKKKQLKAGATRDKTENQKNIDRVRLEFLRSIEEQIPDSIIQRKFDENNKAKSDESFWGFLTIPYRSFLKGVDENVDIFDWVKPEMYTGENDKKQNRSIVEEAARKANEQK